VTIWISRGKKTLEEGLKSIRKERYASEANRALFQGKGFENKKVSQVEEQPGIKTWPRNKEVLG